MVRVADPKVTFPPFAPPPESEPMLWLNPKRSSTTPGVFAKVTAELDPKAFTAPACRTPPFTVVAPV